MWAILSKNGSQFIRDEYSLNMVGIKTHTWHPTVYIRSIHQGGSLEKYRNDSVTRDETSNYNDIHGHDGSNGLHPTKSRNRDP